MSDRKQKSKYIEMDFRAFRSWSRLTRKMKA